MIAQTLGGSLELKRFGGALQPDEAVSALSQRILADFAQWLSGEALLALLHKFR